MSAYTVGGLEERKRFTADTLDLGLDPFGGGEVCTLF